MKQLQFALPANSTQQFQARGRKFYVERISPPGSAIAIKTFPVGDWVTYAEGDGFEGLPFEAFVVSTQTNIAKVYGNTNKTTVKICFGETFDTRISFSKDVESFLIPVTNYTKGSETSIYTTGYGSILLDSDGFIPSSRGGGPGVYPSTIQVVNENADGYGGIFKQSQVVVQNLGVDEYGTAVSTNVFVQNADTYQDINTSLGYSTNLSPLVNSLSILPSGTNALLAQTFNTASNLTVVNGGVGLLKHGLKYSSAGIYGPVTITGSTKYFFTPGLSENLAGFVSFTGAAGSFVAEYSLISGPADTKLYFQGTPLLDVTCYVTKSLPVMVSVWQNCFKVPAPPIV